MAASHAGQKRSRQTPDAYPDPAPDSLYQKDSPKSTSSTAHGTASASSFRNVSACNRCRVRKNRCDQNLPACSACEKAGVKCVGYDPITKREIPRTYVYYLESRVSYLEGRLEEHAITYEACTEFELGSKPFSDRSSTTTALSPKLDRDKRKSREISSTNVGSEGGNGWDANHSEREKISTLVSNIGMVSVEGASDPRYLGSTSGISFARVVAAAIKSVAPDKGGIRSRPGSIGTAAAATGATSIRDSFFGLSSKPSIKPATFPDKELGLKLVDLYFEHANPQIPILHRPDFMTLFHRAYQLKDRQRSARELYMLNIVFAIGAGIILENPSTKHSPKEEVKQEPVSPSFKRQKLASVQYQPEEYHASAMVHLESFLGSMPALDRPEGYGGGLEQLQAVLLLASFALLRPVAPGLWYITGVAVRLGVDLGLHYEDGTLLGGSSDRIPPPAIMTDASGTNGIDARERGRREWVRDLRRRLWWCVYSYDRLVSTCVGRPFGITDQAITTQWPSILEDKDITPEGFLMPSHNFNGPSYKRVSHHYFRLRLLQSEILQVLQYRQAQHVHSKDSGRGNQFLHSKLSSPFLKPFDDSFHAWRKDIDRRLWEWKESAPIHQDTGVRFNTRFLDLNYWQAVILLYRQSLSVPQKFAGEQGPLNEVESPLSPNIDDHESDDEIYLKVAEAGQRVLKLYKQLHKAQLVNYTYLATVHLFMAGIAFLYSLWHSAAVRSRLDIKDVNYTVLAGTTILSDLVDKCPPAEACREAFDRMSKATIAMCQSTTGFGSQVKFVRESQDFSPIVSSGGKFLPVQQFQGSRPPPTFDYNLSDLFPDQSALSAPSFKSDWHFPSSGPSSTLNYPSPAPSNSTTNSMPTSNNIARAPQYDPRLFAQPTVSQPSMSHPLGNSSNLSNNPTASTFDFTPNIDLSTIPDLDFLTQEATSNPDGTYASLGFDGEHNDFQDGSPGMPDLFGGFFFGGPMQNQGDADMVDLDISQAPKINTLLSEATEGMNGRGAWQ